MIFSLNLFALLSIWIVNILFILSLFSQIFLNYKLKTTKGLSDLFILGSFCGPIFCLSYTFGANLPFVYKVVNPFYALLTGILMLQRFVYSDFLKDKNKLLIYFFTILGVIMFICFSMQTIAGINLLGWLPILLSVWKKIPQILKIHFNKSVVGFSALFVGMSLLGYLVELISGLILQLPAQVLFTDLKGIIISLVFIFQFSLYNSKYDFKLS